MNTSEPMHFPCSAQVNPADRGFIVLQHLLLWPLLFIALVNWQAQSIIHLMQAANVPKSSRR